HRAALRAAAQEVLLAVVEHVEERPRDGLKYCGLASAVRADDCRRAALEAEVAAPLALAVGLYVFQFDPCDVHRFFEPTRNPSALRPTPKTSPAAATAHAASFFSNFLLKP